MRKFEIEVLALGMNNSDYPGAFTVPVQRIIKSIIHGKVLHLYSGSSLIGDERVDLEHPNATVHCSVEEFIENDKNVWDWILLDPPYAFTPEDKIAKYADRSGLSNNVPLRRKIKHYFRKHTSNILWLDYCSPVILGFKRKKLWFLLPGEFHRVRVLSWLEKEMELLL